MKLLCLDWCISIELINKELNCLHIDCCLKRLGNTGRVVGHGQNGIASAEGLCTGLHVDQVQAARQSMAALQVLEKLEHVTGEALHGRRGHEAVHMHIAVRARVQGPLDAVDAGRDDGRARRNGGGAAQSSEPDHDLVTVAAAGGRAEEHVVGDIGDDVGARVAVIVSFIATESVRNAYFHFQVEAMLRMLLRVLGVNWRAALAKLLTWPLPPDQDHLVFQTIVLPERDSKVVHWEPEVALDSFQRLL